MQTRTITVTLEKAKEWYNSGNATLKEIALRAFSKEELATFDFTKIKTFENAIDVLYSTNAKKIVLIYAIIEDLKKVSKASAAMFMLNIVRKALNTIYDLHLAKNTDSQRYTWYPSFKLVPQSSTYYNGELNSGEYKKLGEITSEKITYNVLGSNAENRTFAGLGNFNSTNSVCYATANFGFLGCATEEIAKHFGLYFGMLIMEAMYGDMVDFSIVKE